MTPNTTSHLLILALAVSSLHEWVLGQDIEKQGLRRRLVQSEECILTKVDIELENKTSLEQWHCELQSVDSDEAGVQFVSLEGLNGVNLDLEAVSGETTLLAEGAVISGGSLKIPKGSKKEFGKIESQQPAEKAGKQTKSAKKRRDLAPMQPVVRSVLAVRVVAPDKTTTADLATLSGDIFGTGKQSPTVSLSERFSSCSYGQVSMVPYNGQTPSGVIIQDGVVEVNIGTVVNGTSYKNVHNEVIKMLRTYLGISNLPSVFNHVMLCLPSGTSGKWIAYSYVNHWLSVYNDNWCRYPSAQFHEVGHNLGLSHAGEGILKYADQTGFMGYSYAVFNQKMCYNPAKSWQMGWYSQRRMVLDFSQRGGFAGSLIGITDYQHTAAVDKFVHLMIPGPTENLYIGFNRNTGINANTQEGWNQVVVQAQNGTGVSDLRAKLRAGGEYVVDQHLNQRKLIIKVTSINLAASPAYADVNVYLEDCPPGQCGTVCNSPCVVTLAPVAPTPATIAPTPAPVTQTQVRIETGVPVPPASVTVAPRSNVDGNIPLPTLEPVSQNTIILRETFDGGLGAFVSNNGKITKRVVNSGLQSSRSLLLRAFGSRITTSGSYFVGNYSRIQIKFWCYASKGAAGDRIDVALSADDGVTWQTVQTFSREIDFPSDKTWYEKSLEGVRADGVQSIRLRISTSTTSSKRKRKVYLENISVEGR